MKTTIKRVTCTKCGEEFQSNFRICPSCGTILTHHTETTPSWPSDKDLSQRANKSVDAAAGHQAKYSSESKSPSWVDNPPAPWRRFAARYLDLIVNGIVMVLAFGFLFYLIAPYQADQFFSIFHGPGGVILDIVFTSLAGSILTGLIIGLTGSSLGKVIFGVRVMKRDGTLLGPADGVLRDINVLIRGLGLGIPIIALFTQGLAYRRLLKNGTTSWDDGMYSVAHRNTGPFQYALNTIGVILLLTVTVVSRVVFSI